MQEKNKVKISDKVKTCYGSGIIVSKEGDEGILSHYFLVKIKDIITNNPFSSNTLQRLHDNQGGLIFHEKELELIK